MGCGDSRVVPPSLPKKPVDDDLLLEKAEKAGMIDAVRVRSLKVQEEQFDTNEQEEDENDDCEFDFITEKSEPGVVAKVVREFVPVENDNELVIIGVACTRQVSAVQRSKLEEDKILETLRNEGLIARPLKRSPNATGFEIVEENAERRLKFVPVAIQKREVRTETQVTNEAIQEKLAKAEGRRKQQEEVKKARAVTAKAPRISQQIRKEEEQEELRNQQIEKWEQGLRNRELHLMDVQEKLKEKHQRIKGLHFKRSFKGVDPFDEDDE